MSEFACRWCPPAGGAGAAKLKIYNSLTRTKVDFVSIVPGKITMYVCGPTVYDAAHLGHARTYIQFDVVRRILRDVAGYEVTYVMNVTDVDDKIIKRSNERGISATTLAREWERKFLEDMATLNVERPTAMPRVTEYIPEIVAFVETLVQKDLAYELAGSVYFDTSNFQKQGFNYGKLVPESVGSAALLAEGEGALTDVNVALKKKDPKDFALWKTSKENEPRWPSPWGDGRPGWHIECSAMIEATIGNGGPIDIHGGGVDLRFPHHDNELAQQEAFCSCNQTVHYFTHTGHLNIDGLKMSKSLKNFITIRQALEGVQDGSTKFEGVTPLTMRLMFLQCAYNKPADYSDHMVANARSLEKKLKEFFLNVGVALRKADTPDQTQKWTERERTLDYDRLAVQADVRARLLDDFDTPGAVLRLQTLVDAVNVYLRDADVAAASEAKAAASSEEEASSEEAPSTAVQVVPLVVAACAASVARTLRIFGLPDLADTALVDSLVYGSSSSRSRSTTTTASEAVAPVLDALAKFRDDVRAAAKAGDASRILGLCDDFRDLTLPDVGVRLEDKSDGAVWKLEDPEVLKKEKAIKLEEEEEKNKLKALAAEKKAAKAKAQADAANVRPQDLFKFDDTRKFAHFDDDGIPTHDANGEPISKSQLKKLRKEWDKQARLYADAHPDPKK